MPCLSRHTLLMVQWALEKYAQYGCWVFDGVVVPPSPSIVSHPLMPTTARYVPLRVFFAVSGDVRGLVPKSPERIAGPVRASRVQSHLPVRKPLTDGSELNARKALFFVIVGVVIFFYS